ncbi:MAG: zinc-ribbon domain-containing protein [Chloroflexi bacterium]|nr:zinc-ribbon domain-containing protein [Chloroflexota bacterium]
MEFTDRWLVCDECGREFLWDAGEQAWYCAQGFDVVPRRCKPCRKRRHTGRTKQASTVESEPRTVPQSA